MLRVLVILFLFIPSFSLANIEADQLELFKRIRCPICEGQTIDSSNAPIAEDLKKFVKTELEQGKSKNEIENSLKLSYGPDIITEPPFDLSTYILWLLPFFAVGLYIWRGI